MHWSAANGYVDKPTDRFSLKQSSLKSDYRSYALMNDVITAKVT